MQWVIDLIGNNPASVKSLNSHHAYRGGLLQHTKEVVEIVKATYNEGFHDMPLEDLVTCAWVHDLNKTSRYDMIPQESWKRSTKGYRDRYGEFDYKEDNIFLNETAEVVLICQENGLILTRDQIHCITYHHGGWAADASMNGRKLTGGILLHYADMMSTHFDRANRKMTFV